LLGGSHEVLSSHPVHVIGFAGHGGRNEPQEQNGLEHIRIVPVVVMSSSFQKSAMISFLFFLALTADPLIASTIRVPQDFPSIQAAVNAASAGDTVLVSSGVYAENVSINKQICLLGLSGAQSTTIQDPDSTGAWGTPETMVISVDAAGPGVIRGFTIKGNFDVNGAGIRLAADGWTVDHCAIMANQTGVVALGTTTTVADNVFRNNSAVAITAGGSSKVLRNRIFGGDENGIYATDQALIANNLLINCLVAVSLGSGNNVVVRNNVMTSVGDLYATYQMGIRISYNGDQPSITNNIMAFGRSGVSVSSYNSNIPDGFLFAYNDVYMNQFDYSLISDRTNIQGNIKSDPLFCDNDSLFALASDSPCIDAGSTTQQDPDGSIADVGMYGGPDADPIGYAPASFSLLEPPDSYAVIVVDSPYVALRNLKTVFRWMPSFDRDQNDSIRYRFVIGRNVTVVCRDLGCTTRFVSEVFDTLWTDSTFLTIDLRNYPNGVFCYTVEAVDKGGLFKRATTVRSFSIDRRPSVPVTYWCSQNFPNPFNSSTSIRYSLPAQSAVKLVLYDLLGRQIKVLVDAVQPSGFYEIHLDARKLSSGTYFYSFRTENYSTTRTLVVLE